jgi:copper chaperone NosL
MTFRPIVSPRWTQRPRRALGGWAPRLAICLALVLGACSDGPRDIQVGAEECAHCRMMVSEHSFATQLITDRGRPYVFDSIECMAEFLDAEEEIPQDRVRSLWVTDFNEPGRWLGVEDAHFLRSRDLRSPMGLNLSAYASESEARESQADFGGEVLTWTEVRELVATTPVVGGHSHAH